MPKKVGGLALRGGYRARPGAAGVAVGQHDLWQKRWRVKVVSWGGEFTWLSSAAGGLCEERPQQLGAEKEKRGRQRELKE